MGHMGLRRQEQCRNYLVIWDIYGTFGTHNGGADL